MNLNKIHRALSRWKAQYKVLAMERLLEDTGVRLDPEPDLWGILNKTEEENVLARLYKDESFKALLKKYAEGANKAMIMAVKNEHQSQALRLNAQFFCYNSMLLKSRRAYLKVNDKSRKDNSEVREPDL